MLSRSQIFQKKTKRPRVQEKIVPNRMGLNCAESDEVKEQTLSMLMHKL